MDNFFVIEYVLLFIVFGLFQVWAFRQRKSARFKLFPMFFFFILGILLSLFSGWYFLFFVPLIEVSLIISIVVVLLELVFSFNDKQWKGKRQSLVFVELFLVLLYLWIRTVM